MQVVSHDKCGNLLMRHHRYLLHPLLGGQKATPSAFVADKQFAVDELVSDDPISRKETVQIVTLFKIFGPLR